MDKLIFNTENTSGQVKRANTTFSWNICEKRIVKLQPAQIA
jgi:hypothetical protein